MFSELLIDLIFSDLTFVTLGLSIAVTALATAYNKLKCHV